MTASLPTVAILAGGLATRLRPITETIPKALVPVAGRPFLAHQLELLSRQGFSRVVLCIGHLGEQIEAAFGNGHAQGVVLEYSRDGANLAGTAGALRQALPKLGSSFLTLYGDSYLEIDYRPVCAAFDTCGQPALMTVIRDSLGSEPPNAWLENGAVRAYGKKNQTPEMKHIDYGLSLFRAEAFQDIAPLRDLSDLQSLLAREGRLAGYEVTTPYFEIGSPRGLQALECHLKSKPITSTP
ncbi:MAG TPA: sugar phosphate nucleotidyltransferase [Candidatus Methylacidiphilales bacterium]|nr:sugar phosphate nucleotidyltransferase [Candidatus Methylacidiphilales bacterium]